MHRRDGTTRIHRHHAFRIAEKEDLPYRIGVAPVGKAWFAPVHLPQTHFTRAGQDINWFDEGKETLTRRVKQILTGMHWAEEPVSRISHMVSNVRLIEVNPSAAEPAEVTVRCRFLIYRNRVETETDILVGKREDLLRRDGEEWRIARRTILLDQNVLLSKNLTFFF